MYAENYVCEFAFAQMTKANTQSCNEFDSSMIFTIKNTIGDWPDKFQNIVSKSTKAFDSLNFMMVKTVLIDNS